MAVIALFDLDGTVLTFDGAAPGPGRTAMGRASRELYGDDHTQGIRFAGGTDRAIARALLDRAGLPFDEDKVQALIDRYLEHLEVELARRPYRAIGDVAGTVTACTERGARVGLATGNVRRGAAIKLASAGLGDVFDLSRGGYGCDHEVRAEVVRIAIARCGREGPVVVVGDTLQDVAAARAAGAHAVGVAVNQATRDELIAAGADAIVDRCDRALVDALFRVAAWR